MTRQSFSFNAKSAKLLQDERLAFLDGNGLCVWDLASNKREHIWSQKYGFSSLTTNFRRNVMAVAEYGLNPDIHIYDASLNFVHTFSGTFSIIQMSAN
jgi:hypothetical protein